MSILDFVGYGMGAVIAVYVLIRVGAAAFFQSKHYHDERSEHERAQRNFKGS